MDKVDYTWGKNLKAITKYKQPLAGFIKKPVYQKLVLDYDKEFAKAIIDEEYVKYKELINHCYTGIVFCIEPNVLRELFNRYPHYKHFYLFFPSPEYFCQMLMNYDLSDLIKREAFKPIFGATESDLETSIMYNCEKVDIMHNGIRVFAYYPFDRIGEQHIRDVMTILKRISTGIAVNLNTNINYGDQLLLNDLRSIDKCLKYPGIESLRDKAKGLPVICVAAGPSLNTQLDFLKRIQAEVFIVAAMACYKPLLKAGIKADVYTCIDMDPIIEKYFIGEDLKGVKISIEMSCYHGIMDNHEADFIVSQSSAEGKMYLDDLLTTLGIRTPQESRIHGAMTVAMMSIQIANLMGAGEIILLGSDLAYNTTESHVSGASHSSKTQIVKDDAGEEYVYFENYGEKEKIVLPILREEGFNGDKVITVLQFVAYRNYMAMFFDRMNLHPINCSMGLKIPGCTHMKLDEAYAKFIQPNKITKSLILDAFRPRHDITLALESINATIERFKATKSISDEGMKSVSGKDMKTAQDCVNKLLKDPMANFISQNNVSGYFLFKYLDLANFGSTEAERKINQRNQARLLLGSVAKGMEVFIAEYERLLERINQ